MSPKDIPEMSPEESKFIDELYIEMYRKLYDYAYKLLKDPAAAEDIVQDTFLLACAKGSEVFTHPNPKGWLVNALKYTISNHRKTMANMTRLLTFVPMEVLVNYRTVDDELEDNLSLLYGDLAKYKEYELLKKHVIDGYQVAEIAQEYGISISCCKLRLFRAKRKLQKILQKSEI